MGWLRSVGSIKWQVSFAEYRLLYRALLQKRPIILSILLTKATPYMYMASGDLTLCLCIHGVTSCISSIYSTYKKHTYNLYTLYSIHTWHQLISHYEYAYMALGHVYILYTLYVQMTHIYSIYFIYAVYILRRFPPQMQHPLIPQNRKTQIPRSLAVQFNVRFLCDLNLH